MSDRVRRLVFAPAALLLWLLPAACLASAEGGGTTTDPLIVDVDLAICTAIVFLVTLAVLWKFAWGPIAAGLERREQAIADNIATAQSAADETRKLTADYESKLAGAADEVRGIIDEAKRDAERAGQQIVEKAQAKASEEGNRMLREIELAKESALKEISDRGADLAVDLAGEIVSRELSSKDHADLIRKAQSAFIAAGGSQN